MLSMPLVRDGLVFVAILVGTSFALSSLPYVEGFPLFMLLDILFSTPGLTEIVITFLAVYAIMAVFEQRSHA